MVRLLAPLLACLALAAGEAAWGPVVLGGGGAVPGIVLHPRVPGLAYIRTDVGGAYRWDEDGRRWLPLLDHLPADCWNLYGVESLAVDPLDAAGGTVAAALGKYAESWAKPQRGGLAVSHDRGATWREVGPSLAIASNRQQRFGERLAFDAAVPGRLWYASQADGLWRGDGDDWRRIALPGDGGQRPLGLACLVAQARPGGEALWLGTLDQGVLASADGGTTWTPLGGPATAPHRAVATADGHLLVAHAGGLHRHDGSAWTDLTPPGAKGIQSVAADPRDARRLFAAERISHRARLFRSGDGGATWSGFDPARRPSRAWWPDWHWVSSPFAIACDPHRPGRLWLTDWYAAYRCEDVDAAAPALANLVDGLEEIVALALCAPFGGPHQLMSGVADNGGFDHRDPGQAPASTIWSSGGPKGLTCTGIDACPGQPLLAARVGVLGGDRKGGGAGSWTADGGATWAPFARVPGDKPAGGRIAIGADGNVLVWAMHESQGVFASRDRGATWSESEPRLRQVVGKGGVWNWQQPLAADRVAPRTFYLLGEGRLWRSEDGRHWSPGAAAADDGARAVATHPFRAGVLWLGLGARGLARSDDGGLTLIPLPAMERVDLLATGAGADPGHPLLYLAGRAGGRIGVFASRDLGASVEPVAPPGQAFGNQPNILAGDPRQPGRCFLGTNGRGILWFSVAP